MLHGLWHLTWLEIKIFLREPLGAIGALLLPVVLYVGLGRLTGRGATTDPEAAAFVYVTLPVLMVLTIALGGIISLITIISIYREGGILKRLRATPLRPRTILTAHVVVKLLFTAATLAMMVMAGRRYYPVDVALPVVNIGLALLVSMFSIMSMGFVIASIVPTARFAQPIASALFYPMIALSGLFYPIAQMSPGLQRVASFLPLTYVVSLLQGMMKGDPWSAHVTDLVALAVVFAICTAVSARVFRWE